MPKRIPELDGIRGLAILLVLIWHYFGVPLPAQYQVVHRWILMTWSGVDLFFVLSGFLIGGILMDARGAENYFSTFYVRRACRILPLYFVVLLIVGFLLGRLGLGPKLTLSLKLSLILPYAIFIQNFLMSQAQTFGLGVLSITWSLAIEEQFYLTLPLLIWMVPKKHLWKVAALMALAVPVFRSLAYLHHTDRGLHVYVLLPYRAEGLLLGVLLAIAFRSAVALEWMKRNRRWFYVILVLAAMPIVFCWWLGWGVLSLELSTFGYTAFAVFYAAIVVLTLTSQGPLKRIFSLGWLRWLGITAYGLYLFHLLVMQSLFGLFGYQQAQILRGRDFIPWLGAVAATLVIAHFSWKLFESPLVRIGHRFSYREKVLPRATSERIEELAPICKLE